ncbi:MAG TPA: TIGR00375 family protein [Clostridia bacterium]|nr:TIGR00375 family protein [Clostridia bacterium]
MRRHWWQSYGNGSDAEGPGKCISGEYRIDLHIHVGKACGKPVKIPSSCDMTVPRILEAALYDKGLDALGIVDCNSRWVVADLDELIQAGDLKEVEGGGLLWRKKLLVIPGAEVEIDKDGRPFHLVAFFPGIVQCREFTAFLMPHCANVNMSTPRVNIDPGSLLRKVESLGGFSAIAHAFTPYKGYFGSAGTRLSPWLERAYGFLPMLEPGSYSPFGKGTTGHIALELGLSADTTMADRISELHGFPFLSSSDAHSPQRIAREFTVLYMELPSFEGVKSSLFGGSMRFQVANVGIDPRLGKYHRSVCGKCGSFLDSQAYANGTCPACGAKRPHFVKGVKERIDEIADLEEGNHPPGRPPYIYQVPLSMIPGIGPVTASRLSHALGGEIGVLHGSSHDDISRVAGVRVADTIMALRAGRYGVKEGGGGRYGEVWTYLPHSKHI